MSDHASAPQVPRISLIPAEMHHALTVAHAEIARLRLTAEEREAIDRQAKWLVSQAKNKQDIHSADLLLQEAATLRGLLERMG